MPQLAVAELNRMDQKAFQDTLGLLFEQSAWIVAAAWQRRPFHDRDDLFRKLVAVVDAASESEQLALIQAHPDLAGRLAIAGELSAASIREHAAAGLDRLTPEEFARFHRMNHDYRQRFGFPFVIYAREHTKDTILASFETRLRDERDQDIQTALAEIFKIVRFRLSDVVLPAPN